MDARVQAEAIGMAAAPPTSHAARLAYLDGWRGLSILLVLWGHFVLNGHTWTASLGVELFFVLSGRLMADILFAERFPLGEFYRRRVSRIFPGLAAFVLLTFVLTRGGDLAFKPSAAAAALSFTLNYAMVATHQVAVLENLWSLCIEEHAYVLLGAIALIVRWRGLRPLPALLLVAALSMADALFSTLVLGQDYAHVYWRTDAHLAPIFLSAAAYLILRGRAVPGLVPVAALGLGMAVMVVFENPLRYSLGTALFAIAVATLDRAPAFVLRLLSWPGLTRLGIWSYSIYLWQQPFFRLQADGALPMPAALALSMAAGAASFHLVEQPARRWLNANWKPGRLRAAAPAA